jgi:hypothetical protein
MPGIWTFVAVLGAVAGLGHLSLLLTLICCTSGSV